MLISYYFKHFTKIKVDCFACFKSLNMEFLNSRKTEVGLVEEFERANDEDSNCKVFETSQRPNSISSFRQHSKVSTWSSCSSFTHGPVDVQLQIFDLTFFTFSTTPPV